MVTIRLTTWINAPVERCFLLATSREFAASTKTADLGGADLEGLKVNDTISWTLLGHTYTSRVDTVRPFCFYRETMVEGLFKHFEHHHHFAPMDDGTRVRSEIRFTARWGRVGRLLEMTVLRTAFSRMLLERNGRLKKAAESNEWQSYVHTESESKKLKVSEPPRVSNMQRFA
jgi:ligand-binding SRPBCC domain-containing protein